ncbi:MAG: hypothetical protein IJY61_08520 [Candidatus Gastranaerophilales bacterium]|nr:hypothetical protein [Candidatus Gastranaerophilales bacterium]
MDKQFLEQIFSIKKSWDKSHTEIRFCGLKLKMKKKPKTYTMKDFEKIHSGYEKLVQTIKEKKDEKIKVAFLVPLASMFSAKALFERMLKNDNFEVSLVVIPDMRFPQKTQENLDKTGQELIQYKNIMNIVPITEKADRLVLKDIADIVVCSLPYDVSHEQYKLENIIKNGMLPVLVNYGFYRSKYDRDLIGNDRCSLYWKVFTETELNQEEYNNFQKIKGENTFLSGYSKMDSYKNYKKTTDKTTIMIAPHHSVKGGFNDALGLSNFYNYAELFLKLPDMYPDISFIFRPHPALFFLLSSPKYWGQKKVDEYLNRIISKPNVEYSTKGDYFIDFANSDGIIQDCASYLVEYFYTMKPHCYMLKSEKDIEDKFTPLGKQCLENCYIAYDEKAITDFIDNVILKGEDTKKEQREKFAKEVVMYNYPNVSQTIIDYFERKLKCLK